MSVAGTLVVGLGNRMRGDDAVGLEVASALSAARPDLDVHAHEREPIDLIELWAGAEEVIVVDAVAGGDPGRIHRLDGLDEGLAWERSAPASSHAMHLGQVIELARTLGRLPGRMTVIAVEGADFATGSEPSPRVLAAARAVATELAGSVRTTHDPGGAARIDPPVGAA